MIDVYK